MPMRRVANQGRYRVAPRSVCADTQQRLIDFDAALGDRVVVGVTAKQAKRAAIIRRGLARNLAEIALVLGVDVTNLDRTDPTIRRYIQKPSACRHTMNVRALGLDDWIALDSAIAMRRRGSDKKSRAARLRKRGPGRKRGVRSTFSKGRAQ